MKKFTLLLCLISTACLAQSARYDNFVWTASRNVPPGSSAPIYTQPNSLITVCSNPPTPATGAPCTNKVTIYSDVGLTTPITQPLVADSLGQYGFYINEGTYSISIQNRAGQWLANAVFTVAAASGHSSTTIPISQ